MSLLLDSASLQDARTAAELRFVRGVTTNPTLLRRETAEPLTHLAALLNHFEAGDVYYQPTGAPHDAVAEAREAWNHAPERVVLKLMATPPGVRSAVELMGLGARVALTAVQTPQAMAVACAIGCVAVIPYVDRALRDPCTPSRLVAELAAVRNADVRIIAASIKNTGQLVEALRDGADAVSAPLPVLTSLLAHPAALAAETEFASAFGGLR